MEHNDQAASNPQPEDLDQLFKQVMRAVESEFGETVRLCSIHDANLIPTRLGEAEFRESLQSALNESVHRVKIVGATLFDFIYKYPSQDHGFVGGNRFGQIAAHINCELRNPAAVLSACADRMPDRFGDSEFREFARKTLKDWPRLMQHLRSQIRSILSHLDTHGLLIDYVEIAEARRRGELPN